MAFQSNCTLVRRWDVRYSQYCFNSARCALPSQAARACAMLTVCLRAAFRAPASSTWAASISCRRFTNNSVTDGFAFFRSASPQSFTHFAPAFDRARSSRIWRTCCVWGERHVLSLRYFPCHALSHPLRILFVVKRRIRYHRSLHVKAHEIDSNTRAHAPRRLLAPGLPCHWNSRSSPVLVISKNDS